MNILAFDTCLNKTYIALKKDGETFSKIIENSDENYHSAYLISSIKAILKENGLKPADINLIATNIGPGSFTGIRACVTVARIYSQQFDIPVVGVNSLEILSEIDTEATVFLDARKEMAYTDKNSPKTVLLNDIDKNLKVITDNKLKPLFKNAISYEENSYDLGKFLIKIAEKKEQLTWKELLPLYIQPPAVHGEKAQKILQEMSK